MIDQIENISSSFETIHSNTHFMKKKICKINSNLLKLEFQNCHIACARNGGLMAFVRMANFLVLDKSNPIKNNIRIFSQDGKNEKKIPFKWNEDFEIVLFDFTDDEQLYAVIADGTIYKFDIFNKTYTQKNVGTTFNRNNKIISAKLFEKGFVCISEEGSFYIIKDFSKNCNPILFFPKQELFPHQEPVQDYVFVPASVTASSCIELYFSLNSETIHGLFKVKDEPDHKYSIIDENTKEINGVYYAKNSKEVLEEGWKPMTQSSGKDSEDEFGKIKAITLNSNSQYISFYNSKGNAFCFNSQFDKESDGIFMAHFDGESSPDPKTKEEIMKMIPFPEGQVQFMFCGNNALCLASGRYILVSTCGSKTLIIKIIDKLPKSSQYDRVKEFHCLVECDGVRVITKDYIYLISQVLDDVYDVCSPKSNEPSKKLILVYKKLIENEASCDKDLRYIEKDLADAVKSLQMASANMWEKDNQMFLLKAAQLGKNFVPKDSYNYEHFVEVCKNIRIINNLRESDIPRFITYEEYVNITPKKKLINKLIKNQDFYLAYEISKYLDLNVKKVFEKYAIAEIKACNVIGDGNDIFEIIYNKIKDIEDISFIKLAKKAFKYKKESLGLKFLEQEKSILIKIPQYIELNQWKIALDLAFQTHDSNVILTVFDKIADGGKNFEEFIELIKDYNQAEPLVIEYLKKNIPDELPTYLESINNYEELLLCYIERFFKSVVLEDRYDNIRLAHKTLKQCEKLKAPNFDVKFYSGFLTDLENSIKLKASLIEDDIIKQIEDSEFDNSVTDCYRAAFKSGKPSLVENQNKDMFNISHKKINILKVRTFAEMRQIQDILAISNDPSKVKKAQLSYVNLAEIFLELKERERAAEVIKQITELDYFDYKIEMLKSIEKYQEALEIVIKEKGVDIEKKEMLVRELIMRNPALKGRAEELIKETNVDIRI